MKLSKKLSLIGLMIYIFFCLLALWAEQGEGSEAEPEALSFAHLTPLFFSSFFLPGFLMSLAWARQKQREKKFSKSALFVLGGTALYSLTLLAGIDDPLGLFSWVCLSSCGLLLLHHHLLEPLNPLPQKLLLGLIAAAVSMIPITLALKCFTLGNSLLVFTGFLSYPLWGWLMGNVARWRA